eukprot:TRINITY_DN10273_c0_g1_i1.p1 TRINITY_DN10273_c0_g1~~TRINITY_DN10273_c0_g1_i1.p1  ORF type:complete len:450 (-),score=92.35 TRINITY_DN10273_c0_g1_i1:33-1382(-)
MSEDRGKALQLYNKGDYNGSLQALNDAIGKPPVLPVTYLLRSTVHAKLNNHALSTEDLKTFAKVDGDWIKSNPRMTGYLRKEKKRAIGSAQKRFFFLKNKFLFWYRSPLENEPLSAVCLMDASIESIKTSRTSFKLDVLGTSWVLDALTETMYAEWMAAMRESLGEDPWSLIIAPDNDRQTREERKRSTTLTAFSGFLNKRGERYNGWKVRWFELKNELLSYYESPTSKALGTIDVRGAKLTKDPDDPAKFCFQIRLPDRVYFLSSDKEEDKGRWIAVLSQVSGVDVSELNRAASAVLAAASGSSGAGSSSAEFQPPKRTTKDTSRFKTGDNTSQKTLTRTQKPVGRRLGNSQKSGSLEVSSLETPTELVSSSSPLDLDDDEKRRNAEAIRQAKQRREQFKNNSPKSKTRQEELRERLLDGEEEDSTEEESLREPGPLQKCNCAGCNIL